MKQRKWVGDNVKLNIKLIYMKRYILFLLLILFSNNSYSQSVSETKDWIGNNMVEYYYQFGINNRIDMSVVQCNYYMTYFYKDLLYVEISNCDPKKVNEIIYYVIDIKTIRNIKRFSGPTMDYDFNFGSRIDEQLWITANYVFKTKDKNIYAKIKSDNILPPSNDVMVVIKSNDNRILENNIPNRIIKAFEHLVKLYGGNMTSDSLF
jgi:hypothetical protein